MIIFQYRIFSVVVARNVCKNPQYKVGESFVEVTLHFSCLGERAWPDVVPETLPDPVNLVTMETCLLKFVHTSAKYTEKLQQDLRKVHGTLVTSEKEGEITAKVGCTLDMEDRELSQQAKTWEGSVQNVWTNFCENMAAVRLLIEDDTELWDLFKERLNSLVIDNEEDVATVLLRNTSSVVIVGEKKAVEDVHGKVKIAKETAQSDLKDEKEKITDTMQQQTPSNVALLVKMGVKVELEIKYSGLVVSMDTETGQITLVGKRYDVPKAKCDIMEQMTSVDFQNFNFRSGRLEMLSREEVIAAFYRKISDVGGTVVIENMADKERCKIWGIPNTNFSLVKDVLEQFLVEYDVQIPEEFDKFCDSTVVQDCRKEMEDMFWKFHLDIVRTEKVLRITATSDVLENVKTLVKKATEKFLEEHGVKVEFVQTVDGAMEFIKGYLQDELKDNIGSKVKITPGRQGNRTGYDIRGNKTSVEAAKRELKEFIKNEVKEVTHKITKPGVRGFFYSRDGKKEIHALADIQKCVIHLEDTERKPHWSGNPTSSPDKGHMGQRSGQVSSTLVKKATCEVGGVEFKVFQGDITKLKVAAIVNCASPQMKFKGGMAKAIVQAGKVVED